MAVLKNKKPENSNSDLFHNIIQKPNKRERYSKFIKHKNSIQATKLGNDKWKTNSLLRSNNINVPNSTVIITDETIDSKLTKQLNFPLVIKPIEGTQGRDVYTNIGNMEELLSLIKNLKSDHKKLLVEEQVDGNNYRILVYKDKIVDIVERVPATIVGNGTNTLEELIQIRNRKQIDDNNYQTYMIDYDFMWKQFQIDKDSIVPKGLSIQITNVCNFHNGCNPITVNIDKFSRKELQMFIKTNQILGLEYSGIDYIKSDTQKSGKIIEVNPGADMKIHLSAKPYRLHLKSLLESLYYI